MAKQERKVNSAPSGKTRVRVKKGAMLRIGGHGELARPGTWIELDEADFLIDYIRACVETEEDIARAEEEAVEATTRNEATLRQFEMFRAAAKSHNQAFADARRESDRHLARELLYKNPEMVQEEQKRMAEELNSQPASA
jgi:hypothetical protein